METALDVQHCSRQSMGGTYNQSVSRINLNCTQGIYHYWWDMQYFTVYEIVHVYADSA